MGFAFGVGRAAPAFTLTSFDGQQVSLGTYRGDWLPVLLFYDPAHPEAARRLAALSAAGAQFWGLRGQLVAIAAAPAKAQAALAAEVPGLGFPLLVDDGVTVARAYAATSSKSPGVWFACIVDRAGKLVWVAEGEDAYRPTTLLSALADVAR